MIDNIAPPTSIASNLGQNGSSKGGLASENQPHAKIPESLQNIKIGGSVDALVLKQSGNIAQLQISQNGSSAKSIINVTTPVQLNINSNITLSVTENTKLPAGENIFQAKIISVDGKNVQTNTVNNNQANIILKAVNIAPSNLTSNRSAPVNPAVNIAGQSTINATIINVAQGSAQILPNSNIKAGDNIQIQLTSNKQAATSPPPASAAGNASLTQGSSATISNTNPNIVQNNASTTYGGTSNNSNVATVQNQNIVQLSGTVINAPNGNSTILQTPIGNIQLPANISLATGSVVNFNLLTSDTSGANKQPIELQNISNIKTEIAQINAIFQQLHDSLQQIDRGTKTTFPTADKHAAAKLLWFVGNIATGSAAQWIGDKHAKQLDPEILKNINKAFSGIKSIFAEPNQAGWQTMPFPFIAGEEVNFGVFYSRNHQHQNDDSENESGDNDTRFIVEIELQSIGDIQMDGLIKKTSTKTEFNLIIRTKESLSNDIQSDISKIFDDMIAISGFNGVLSFQKIDKSSPHPTEEILSDTGKNIIV